MGKPLKIISKCPFCSGDLNISRLTCPGCKTQIDSTVSIPVFFRLPEDLQEFVMVFLKNRGNIRDVERELGISYPTVCKRLDQANELLGNQSNNHVIDRNRILERLENGEITAKEAAQLLKGKS